LDAVAGAFRGSFYRDVLFQHDFRGTRVGIIRKHLASHQFLGQLC
jgi:hypothetical protein